MAFSAGVLLLSRGHCSMHGNYFVKTNCLQVPEYWAYLSFLNITEIKIAKFPSTKLLLYSRNYIRLKVSCELTHKFDPSFSNKWEEHNRIWMFIAIDTYISLSVARHKYGRNSMTTLHWLVKDNGDFLISSSFYKQRLTLAQTNKRLQVQRSFESGN